MTFSEFINLNVVPLEEAVVRVIIAYLFGLLLGWERNSKNKPIDMHAYIIVSVTTCIIAIMGQELALEFSKNDGIASLDLGKIVEGGLTGLGFLGAGAIIKKGDGKLVGTATGASIWAAGSIGLCLGFGFYGLALLAFILVALALYTGKYIMRRIPEQDGVDTEDQKK